MLARMLRKILLSGLVFFLLLIVVLAGLYWWYSRPLPILTVVTWPGPYGRAQAAALMRPFAAVRAIDVHIADYDGGLIELTGWVRKHQYDGDVIDMELPDAVSACRQGLLEHIDATALPAGQDGVPASRDFVAGAVGPCWVGSAVYSQAIAFSPGAGWGPAPTQASDFFDLVHYPGLRAVSRASPKFILELALLADGVAPASVYALLATPEGQARAFSKLDTLKGRIAWLNSPSDAIDALQTRQAVFALVNNGDYFTAGRKGFHPGVIWDRQFYELDVFGVPAGDPKKESAMDFIRFATGSAPLAGVADWYPVGPARRSAWLLVGSNPELHIAMTPWLPTTHFDTAFAVDDAWWQVHAAPITAQWQEWLNAAH